MKILFVSNWRLADGIAQATVRPLIELFQQNPSVTKVIVCSIESADSRPSTNGKIHHFPVSRGRLSGLLLNLKCAFAIRRIVAENPVDMIWCKGSTAGAIGVMISALTGLPFVVDSFEPHAEYMIQAGQWRRFSLRYIIQSMFERAMRGKAIAILPVSWVYEQLLRKRAVPDKKLFVVPCVVNRQVFRFDPIEREVKRSGLGVSKEMIVGIYVGKYGGLYYEEEAFGIYKKAFEFWGQRFFLLLITESDQETIRRLIIYFDLPKERILVTTSAHYEIPAFLNAADFAFSTVRSNAAMAHCSPIKHGEYWACGLPILSTLMYGDDSQIIDTQEGGVLLDLSNPDFDAVFGKTQEMFESKSRHHFAAIAQKYRDLRILDSSIDFVLSLPELQN